MIDNSKIEKFIYYFCILILKMDYSGILIKLEGLQTIETVAEILHLRRQSALNLLSKLKKEDYVTASGGGRQKKIYKITLTKQRKRDFGMFDTINKYSSIKVAPWYDHQVHGSYGPEEALIDALETKSFRVILASLCLFNHIEDWPKLYQLAKEKDSWQKIMALYDLARLFLRVRKIPERYRRFKAKHWLKLTQLRKKNFPEISQRWKVYLPFNRKDIEALT